MIEKDITSDETPKASIWLARVGIEKENINETFLYLFKLKNTQKKYLIHNEHQFGNKKSCRDVIFLIPKRL